MSGTINAPVTRPAFAEGQVLGAADLSSLGDYARGRAERHDRYRHRSGIVTGLALDFSQKPRLFVTPGIAVDALGREIVVTERVELDARRFQLTVGGGPDAQTSYPVLLRSSFRPSQTSGAGLNGRCVAAGVPRTEEVAEILFGRAGDEAGLDDTAASGPSGSPSAAEGAGPPLLLGFVTWDPVAGQFAGTADAIGSAARQLAGVNAAVVAGAAGTVLVQPRPAAATGMLAFELSETDAILRFGRWQGPGRIDTLFSVDDSGNVTAKGALIGRPARGTVLVSAGQASDGLLLPLPPTVTADQVSRGEVAAQVIVTPHIDPGLSPDPTRSWAALAEECRIDDDRRLRCRICWMSLDFTGGAQGAQIVSGPGLADYLVICTSTAVAGA